MLDFIARLFDVQGFMPRWECGAWSQALGWTHIVADLLTWGAYTAIPIVLVFLVSRRRDVPFPRIFILFGAFILLCGTVHLVEATLFFRPHYRLSALVKAATAIVSWGTVFALVPIVPKALAFASPAELRRQIDDRTRELRSTADELRVIFDTAPDAVLVTDANGRIVRANSAAETAFRAPDGLRGLPLSDLFAPPAAGVAAPMGAATPEPREAEARRRDGTAFPAGVNVGVLAAEAGGGSVVMVRDVSARKRAEEERAKLEAQVQHAQKLESLGVLAGGIAHDFNNLLVGILGNAGLALKELSPESPARGTVRAIETAAQRAADLTRQMLAYSGKGRFVVQPLDLSALVEEMAHLLKVSISKQATLKYSFSRDLPPVIADATQLRQVVMNLITNASDALGDRPGVISVATGAMDVDRGYLRATYLAEDLPGGRYVFLEVADTGCGMDETVRERIFDPFFSTKFTGRGLGLAAVLGIVRGHRGAIRVYSEVGRGTTFKVLFPASDAAARPPVADAERPARSKPRSGAVLVADDEPAVREFAARVLSEAGYEVIEAQDGADAVARFREAPARFVAVLLDMTMPKLSGADAFREMRRLRPDVQVILSSGYNEQDATQHFIGKGLAAFLQKPYRSDALVDLVDAVVERGAPA
ncbi:MAG TPA: response regulator [Planctomycetota bacterium]|nr:response regulator [Planctomycetota bacterium]